MSDEDKRSRGTPALTAISMPARAVYILCVYTLRPVSSLDTHRVAVVTVAVSTAAAAVDKIVYGRSGIVTNCTHGLQYRFSTLPRRY